MRTDPKREFDRDAILAALRAWWRELEENRGDRAALRRCASPTEAFFVPAYHRLYSALAPCGWSSKDAVAAIAGLAALVREDTIMSLPTQMAQPKSSGGSVVVSEMRFRRLLKHQTREELYPALGRVIRSLDGRVSLVDLAESVYWWSERVRKRWAFDYYGVAAQNDNSK